MLKFFKEWYDSHLTDPNQVSLALIILFTTLITYILLSTVVPILVAVILAYMLEGLVQRFQDNINFDRKIAVIIVFLLFLFMFMFLIFTLIPLMLDQLTVLIKSLPAIIEKSKELIGVTFEEDNLVTPAQIDSVFLSISNEITTVGKNILASSLSSAGSLFELIIYMLIVPILIFFLLYDKSQIFGWFQRFFPEKLDLTKKAYNELDMKIGNYIRCKFIEIIIVWIASFIIFGLIGLKYTLLLSFLCGVSVIIPYVGAIAVTIPIIFVSYFQWGLTSDFWIIMTTHVLIQVIDGNVVVPILFSDAVSIHPFAILLAILFFGSIWGIWGVFFAIPLAVFLNTLLNIWPKINVQT
tara:strand:- start:320 stop:1378 length:1059 start_codon:yes stop_codon:yes gene_type:complete